MTFIAYFLMGATCVFGALAIPLIFWLNRDVSGRRPKADPAAIARLERDTAEALDVYVSRHVAWCYPDKKI